MGWPEAETRFVALVTSGKATAEQLVAAAGRYVAAMADTKDRTTVQQASTFLGPQKQTWREYLDPSGGNGSSEDDVRWAEQRKREVLGMSPEGELWHH